MGQLPKEWKDIFSKFSEEEENGNLIFFLHFYKKELYEKDKIDGISILDPLCKNEPIFEKMNLPLIPLSEFCNYFITRDTGLPSIPFKDEFFIDMSCQYELMYNFSFVIRNFSKFKAGNIWMEMDGYPYRFIVHLDFGKEKGHYTMVSPYRHFVDQIKYGRERFGSEVICQFATHYSKYLNEFRLNPEEELRHLRENLTEEEKLYLECSV